MKEDELLMRRLRASLLKKKGLSLVTQYLGNCSDCCGMVKGGKLKQKEKKKRFSLPPRPTHSIFHPRRGCSGRDTPTMGQFPPKEEGGKDAICTTLSSCENGGFFGKFKCSRSLNICSVLMSTYEGLDV